MVPTSLGSPHRSATAQGNTSSSQGWDCERRDWKRTLVRKTHRKRAVLSWQGLGGVITGDLGVDFAGTIFPGHFSMKKFNSLDLSDMQNIPCASKECQAGILFQKSNANTWYKIEKYRGNLI